MPKSEVVACRLTPETLAKLDEMVGPAPFFSRARTVEHLIKIAVERYSQVAAAAGQLTDEKEKETRAVQGPQIYG